MERRANLARQALEDGDVAGAYRIAAQNFGGEGPGLCRCRVGGGVHRADPDGRPQARGRAFHPLPGGGGDADQPRAGRLLAGARVRGERRRRGGARAPSAWGRSTRRASTASSPPRSSACPPTPGSPAGGRRPTGATAPDPAVLGGEGGLLPAPRRRRPAGLAVLPPRRRGPAAGDAGGAGADGDRPRPAADRHPHRQGRGRRGDDPGRPVLSAARGGRGGAGRCRPST